MGYAGGGAAAAGAAIAQAIKASGAIVRVDPQNFLTLLGKVDSPLVVVAVGGIFKKNYQYLTHYKGLIFYTKCDTFLTLPGDAEMIKAGKIWIPG